MSALALDKVPSAIAEVDQPTRLGGSNTGAENYRIFRAETETLGGSVAGFEKLYGIKNARKPKLWKSNNYVDRGNAYIDLLRAGAHTKENCELSPKKVEALPLANNVRVQIRGERLRLIQGGLPAQSESVEALKVAGISDQRGLLKSEINYLISVSTPWVLETWTLIKALGSIKKGKWKDQIESLRELKRSGGEDGYRSAKEKLPAFCFNGTFLKRVLNANFLKSSGFLIIDVDYITGDELERIRRFFRQCPYVFAAWLSPGAEGLKALIYVGKVEIVDDAGNKIAFAQIKAFFTAAGIIIDGSGSDISRKCFASYDPDLWVNFDVKAFPLNEKVADNVSEQKPATSLGKEPSFDEFQSICSDITLDNCDEYLLDPDCEYLMWIKVGAALHQQGDGKQEWFEKFVDWSSQGSKFQGREDCEKHWRSFGKSTQQLTTFKTLIKWKNEREAQVDDVWETPNEIAARIPPVMSLPVEIIPEPFRPWLEDVSYRMQTPHDFTAVSTIIVVGSIIGSGCGIRPKSKDDWEAIPNLWGACIGRPSVVLKTPSMGEVTQVLDRLQAEYGEIYELAKGKSEFQKLSKEISLNHVKKKMAGAKDPAALEGEYLALCQRQDDEPVRRMFKTNETSVQSMTVLQNQNPRGLLVYRDELMGLFVKWDTENGSDERAYFLEGWNGNGSYTDFKIGRGLTEAPNICISLLGGIQPDKLRRYLYQAQHGSNDGLMQRLQLTVWPDEPTDWQLVDLKPNAAEKQRASDIMRELASMDFCMYGAEKEPHSKRPHFHFDDAGQAVFNEWLTELQTIKIRNEENPLMVEHFGKFRSLMPSLALIFHCIEIADGKGGGGVSEVSARLAVRWCQYLESHARRIYAMAEIQERAAAISLSEKIKAQALSNPFTAKMVYDKGWHGLKDKAEVEAACDVLIDENWLKSERKPVSAKGGRPLTQYHINPKFL